MTDERIAELCNELGLQLAAGTPDYRAYVDALGKAVRLLAEDFVTAVTALWPQNTAADTVSTKGRL